MKKVLMVIMLLVAAIILSSCSDEPNANNEIYIPQRMIIEEKLEEQFIEEKVIEEKFIGTEQAPIFFCFFCHLKEISPSCH